jgi:hypothetical protein
MAKIVTIRSYDSMGTFIKNITDSTFSSFRKTINGGLSDLTLKLARKIDSFNPNLDVSLGNRIEVWVYDEDTGVDGLLIYSGYVEQQNPYIDGGQEYVEIVCFGLVSKLTSDVLKSGSQTRLYTKATDGLTITVADQNDAEVAEVLRAIVDYFNVNNPTFFITHNPNGIDSIVATGNNINYTFDAMTYLNSIEKCRSAAPQFWYWYLGADAMLNFKAISSTPDHTFLLSKEVKKIKASRSADSIKNILLLSDGAGTYKQYKDDVSIALYGRRVKQMTDSNIKDSATMDNIGNSFIQANKDPKVRLEIEIIDSNESTKGYDIESIQPGQTCQIVGIDISENIFTSNMIIQEVTWELGKVTLTIDTEKTFDINKLILQIEKKVDTATNDVIESYT